MTRPETDPRLYPARPFLASSVAVLREGRVLVARRAHPPGGGVFSLPGGVVEAGETLAEAALRELREEVQVEAEILGLVAPVEVIEPDPDGRTRRHFVVLAHAGRWIAGEGTPGEEALDIRWVTPAELDALPTTPGLAAVVRQALLFEAGIPDSGVAQE